VLVDPSNFSLYRENIASMVRSTHLANCSIRWPVRAMAVQLLFKGIGYSGESVRPGPKRAREGRGKELVYIVLGQTAYTGFHALSRLNCVIVRAARHIKVLRPTIAAMLPVSLAMTIPQAMSTPPFTAAEDLTRASGSVTGIAPPYLLLYWPASWRMLPGH
jgi:hypothetical protein